MYVHNMKKFNKLFSICQAMFYLMFTVAIILNKIIELNPVGCQSLFS